MQLQMTGPYHYKYLKVPTARQVRLLLCAAIRYSLAQEQGATNPKDYGGDIVAFLRLVENRADGISDYPHKLPLNQFRVGRHEIPHSKHSYPGSVKKAYSICRLFDTLPRNRMCSKSYMAKKLGSYWEQGTGEALVYALSKEIYTPKKTRVDLTVDGFIWDRKEAHLAVSMAKDIYVRGDYEAVPILADVVQEAGCTNKELLAHMREPLHYRGCWAIDYIRKLWDVRIQDV